MDQRHTILVVDDEPDVVQSVKDLLRLDYRVLGATSAEEGLRLLTQEEVHVVMTDQRMPGMSGVEFLRRCRGQHPEAIRLLFTGYADIHAVIAAINQGNVYRYITKPWDPEELFTIIREAAERYDLLVERQRLLGELQAKNQELEAKNRELRAADQLKTAFIDVASHELRTPLTVLRGATWLAQRQPDLPPALADVLGRIARAGHNLSRVVDQITRMLTAGRFELPLERQEVDLGALLRAALDEVRPFAALRGQSLVLDLEADPGTLPVDAGKIRDSLHNLLMNAIKFTPDRGTIALSARRTAGGGAELAVRDTGIGIPPASLGLIFEPFFTAFDTLHHSSGHFEFGTRGIGLGLTAVRRFAELHGGSVRAESEAGRGTTVTITLPAPPAPPPSAAAAGTAGPA